VPDLSYTLVTQVYTLNIRSKNRLLGLGGGQSMDIFMGRKVLIETKELKSFENESGSHVIAMA
jgi:hypothetical protein